jgi:hypothetical protein
MVLLIDFAIELRPNVVYSMLHCLLLKFLSEFNGPLVRVSLPSSAYFSQSQCQAYFRQNRMSLTAVMVFQFLHLYSESKTA